MDKKLEELLKQIQTAMGRAAEPEEEEFGVALPEEEEKLTPADHDRIEDLFQQAARNRSKAYELKQELDRLDVFKEYEDRFLDLFKVPQ